jgi:hypothetical protein
MTGFFNPQVSSFFDNLPLQSHVRHMWFALSPCCLRSCC